MFSLSGRAAAFLRAACALSLALLPALACEQPRGESRPAAAGKGPRRIAVLVVSDLYAAESIGGLKEGMRQLGYREGESVEFAVYNAGGDESRLAHLARQAVESEPDVLCPSVITAILAVKATGTRIPVVFLESMYPVEFGIVASLTRPGGNYTGVSNMTGPMSGKRLELLSKIAPGIRTVALLYSPENKVAVLSLEKTRSAAAALGLRLDAIPVHSQADLDAAIGRLRADPADALVLNPDFLVFSRLAQIAAVAREKRMATMGIDESQVGQGILASYGGGLRQIARQAARQVDRVLRGEPPGSIPVEEPRKYRLFLNLTTAEEIGVRVPDEILYQAEGFRR